MEIGKMNPIKNKFNLRFKIFKKCDFYPGESRI